jgi:predicted Zn-dependent protease
MAAAGTGAALGGAAGQFANMGFTRKDEDEADKYGFLFYTRSGWDPFDFGHFFQIMIDKGLDKGVAFLSDHPTLASRVETAKERASQLGPDAERYRQPPVATPARFRALQDRTVQVARTMPSDTTLSKQTQELLQALPRSCLTPAVQADQVRARKQLQDDLERQSQHQQQRASAGTPAADATEPPASDVISRPRGRRPRTSGSEE